MMLNRRTLFQAAAVLLTGRSCIPEPWFNYQTKTCWPPDIMARTQRGKVFVDGTEVKQVWYANVGRGVVGTYDVYGDGKVHLRRGCKMPRGSQDVMSKSMHGKVEIFGPNGDRA